jgi:hypothetical protein
MNIMKENDLPLNEKKEPGLFNPDSNKKENELPNSYLSKLFKNNWENIPSELKYLDQWVTWKSEIRDGKITKVPYQPNGMKANVTDRNTWSSFKDVEDHEKVGFVFTNEDPYVFIDIDGNKETGTFSPSASFWISKFDSYTEYSPSKSGFHIIIKGNKKFPNCRRGDFEIYEKNRFATFTGNVYKNYVEINKRQDVLDGLQKVLWGDEIDIQRETSLKKQGSAITTELSDIAKFAEKDKKLKMLWSGDISEYKSHSEADLSLCEKLAYYTGGDFSIVEQLFECSDLVTEKWLNRSDYKKNTINKALSSIQDKLNNSSDSPSAKNNQDYPTKKYQYPKPISLSEIMRKEFHPRKDVIQDLIPAGLTMTMGPEKIGKSSMNRQTGFLVATGQSGFGGTFSPAVSGHVLYLSFEDDDHSIKESMELFCQNSAPVNYQFQYTWPKIGKGCMRALESYLSDFPNTKLIIIDTWAYIRSKDNGKTSFGRYNEDVEDLNKLKKFCDKHNLSIIISTHTKKGKEEDWTRNVHGGVGQTATVDTIIFIDRKRESSNGYFRITGRRIKDKSIIASFEQRSWILKNGFDNFNLTSVMQEYWDIFIDNENISMTPKDFTEKLYPDLNPDERDKKYDSVRQQLSRMVKSKKLKKVERSYYKMFTEDYESYKNMRNF